ncbi:HlyD family secretion protein [Niabella beijingensis]|uniref:HlyD family secretion protein n=1 Tax=Niabella beijingensis TaxID=2872700 RepID=UPI001CC0EA41|nr:HlyD family efflux transporter periplasmic adaptor subunit [Niabella beijingensis]MBZ4190585.1 HlyD family secretion protein [Niabella beijingensis]
MNNKHFESNTMEEIDTERYRGTERTEEVRDIIERMPTKFGWRVSMIVVFIFLLLLFFGWIIRYPDIVKGQVTINTPVAPIKLVANSAGKIKLNRTVSQSRVNGGDIVGYIESATSYDTLCLIKEALKNYNPNDSYNTSILATLPSRVALGDLTSRYYGFLGSLQQMANFNNNKLYDKQIQSLRSLREHQMNEVRNSSDRININKSTLEYSEKFLKRDSILYAGKVAAEAELDRTKMEYLSTQSGYANARSSQIDAEKQAQQTLSKITEVDVQKNEKRKELEIALLAAYNDLIDNITLWEQRYLFKAPFKGQVQFLRFWTDDQFVQAQEPVFTIIPDANEPYGQVALPALGAGKVKTGQEVIVKLDDFPYNEYGSITGIVNNISLTTNTEKTQQGNVETYLVTVKFPKGLITNYGKPIAFRHEAKGAAEIITKDRRLIERLFDNLKYALNK